jgi:LacI family transcriptional regulator
MTHRYPIKEIALQAGMSTATVDRVLNGRAHVSPQTRRRVTAALDELASQEAQMAARGRRLFVDVVAEAPARFTREIRRAAEAVLPGLGGAVLRPRFTFREEMTEAETLAVLARIARRGSHGICLKARDLPSVRAALADLAQRGIPVVTLVTDIASPDRLAYAGPDNARAGATAAWLVAKMVPGQGGAVLTTLSQHSFLGEEARLAGFRTELARLRPDLVLADASGGARLNLPTARAIERAVADRPGIVAVYSMGGGNVAILDTLARAEIAPQVFLGHDLDTDNLRLLAAGRLSLVLHHDLAEDMRAAFLRLLAWHRLIPALPPLPPSELRIITPANIPASVSGGPAEGA